MTMLLSRKLTHLKGKITRSLPVKIYDYNGQANIVGKKILEFRKQQKLSQEELAAKMQLNNIEISQKVISRIEKQERFVTDYELLVFSKVLGVDIYELLEP